MRTTVVHRRADARHAGSVMPCSRDHSSARIAIRPRGYATTSTAAAAVAEPWSTAKLGLVISTVAAIAAVAVDIATSIPTHVVVLTVMAVAFGASLHATTRRSLH